MRIRITEFIDHLELFKAIHSPPPPQKKKNQITFVLPGIKKKHLSRVVFAPKNEMIVFSMNLSGGFRCGKEPSHLDGSFEYPQHIKRSKKNIIAVHTHLEACLYGHIVE